MTRDRSFALLVAGMAAGIALAVLLLVASCSHRVGPAVPPVTAPTSPFPTVPARPPGGGIGDVVPAWATPAVLSAIDRANAADRLVQALAGQLTAAKAAAKTEHEEAEQIKREARLAPVRSLLLWFTWAAVGVSVLSVGLAIFTQRLGALWLAAAGCGVALAAQFTSWALDHYVLVGATVAGLGAVLALVGFLAHRSKSKGLEAAVLVAESLKPELETDVQAQIRRTGQLGIVAKVGAVAGREIAKVRERLGVA